MKDINRFLIYIIFLLLLGCSSGLSVDRYITHVEKCLKEKHTKITRNNYEIKIARVPAEYYAAKDFVNNKSGTLFDEIQKYKNSMFILIEIDPINAEKDIALSIKDISKDFKQTVIKSEFEKKKDLFLEYNKDTLYTSTYRYEPTKMLGAGKRFFLTFDKNKISENQTLIFRSDRPEIGTIKIKLKDVFNNYKKLGYK